MSVIINGDTGITTPAETVQGALTTTGNTILGDASTDTLNVGNGGLVKDASGNVGIGTASPTQTAANRTVLSVNGTTTAIVNLNAGGVNKSYFYFDGTNTNINSAAGLLSFQTDTASAISFNINGATEQARIDSAGLLKFNSGYGSAATAYGCRAWVNFNGTGTVAIRASGNVSSITDNGVGNYTINFTTAMVDANYAMTASGVFTTSASDYKLTFYPVATPATTTTLQVRSTAASSDGAVDAVINCCSIFR